MTPTNIDTAAKVYSKKFIAGLTRALAALRAFSIDFSEEAKQFGEAVLVALLSADAAADWNDTSNNFNRTAATLGDRNVPLNKRKVAGFAITPAQMANFNPAWWEGKADLDAASIADAILSDVAALVTADNFGDAAADKIQISLDGFGPKAVATIRAKAIAKKLRVNRSVMCLNPSYFSQLLGNLDANVYGGREAIEKGVIPGLLGFNAIAEIPQLEIPGFVAHPGAIAVAGRTIPFFGTKPYEKVQTFIEPETGMPMTNVVYVDGPTGKGSTTVNAMYGCAKGADDQLIRLIDKAAA